MKRFKSARQAPHFLSAHDQIANLFQLRRDHVTAEVLNRMTWVAKPVFIRAV